MFMFLKIKMLMMIKIKIMVMMMMMKMPYLGLALASQVDVAPFHLLPDHPGVDQEQTTCHLHDVDVDDDLLLNHPRLDQEQNRGGYDFWSPPCEVSLSPPVEELSGQLLRSPGSVSWSA